MHALSEGVSETASVLLTEAEAQKWYADLGAEDLRELKDKAERELPSRSALSATLYNYAGEVATEIRKQKMKERGYEVSSSSKDYPDPVLWLYAMCGRAPSDKALDTEDSSTRGSRP